MKDSASRFGIRINSNKIVALVGELFLTFILISTSIVFSSQVAAEETLKKDFWAEQSERSHAFLNRLRESLNRMDKGTRFTVPYDPKKKKNTFQVTQAYLDSKIIDFIEQRSFEVISNELNASCLQCKNWNKIFGKNPRLPSAEQCAKLRKENEAGGTLSFPPHTVANPVGNPCSSGYLVKTTTGAKDNCYCMAEDLAEKSYAHDLTPVTSQCEVEFYDKKSGEQLLGKSFPLESSHEALIQLNQTYSDEIVSDGKRFIPNMSGKPAGPHFYYKPHQRLQYTTFTNADLYLASGQPALPRNIESRVRCPDAPAHIMEPKVTRLFSTGEFSSDKCPCRAASSIPESLNLPALKRGYVDIRTYGENLTYKLVDNSRLPKEYQMKKTASVRRTGYGRTDNSPPGDNAGFAAMKRKAGGSVGRANLGVNGKGTLNNPVTAAISPDFARKYGVCQGDMLFDPKYGWLRVEGGCTKDKHEGKYLGERVDVWRDGMSKQEEGLNVEAQFVHFPAGLVDKTFADENPGPLPKAILISPPKK